MINDLRSDNNTLLCIQQLHAKETRDCRFSRGKQRVQYAESRYILILLIYFIYERYKSTGIL